MVLQESEGQQLPMGDQPWPWLAHHQGHKVTLNVPSVSPLPRTASHPEWTAPMLDLWWTWPHQVGNSRVVCDMTPHGEVQGTTPHGEVQGTTGDHLQLLGIQVSVTAVPFLRTCVWHQWKLMPVTVFSHRQNFTLPPWVLEAGAMTPVTCAGVIRMWATSKTQRVAT